ncbi:hypothetical protein SteCoe_34038 [Stentor coeruleus]|uniref:Uncharacterized protein n=1 Tax=Stentor coeruleus TaxID=5963 RepID=A0A1R2AVG8_9CILI|nr:hypothetical protein SteCoe_34038 [Stentor coeruleus]
MIAKKIEEILLRAVHAFALITSLAGLIKSFKDYDLSWPIIFIPLLISIALLMPYFQILISNSYNKLQSSSVSLFIFSSYSLCFSAFAFSLLVSLKIQDLLTESWYFIFIPLWYAVFTFGCFCVFMFPGLMDPTVNLQREAWTLASFTFTTISTSIMIPMWFEEDINDLWVALLPFIIGTFISLIFCVYSKIWNRKKGKNILDRELILYTSILPLSITSSIKAYDNDFMPTFVLYLLIIKFLVLSWVIEERKVCKDRKDEEGYSEI